MLAAAPWQHGHTESFVGIWPLLLQYAHGDLVDGIAAQSLHRAISIRPRINKLFATIWGQVPTQGLGGGNVEMTVDIGVGD